jgi:hypothetical protein
MPKPLIRDGEYRVNFHPRFVSEMYCAIEFFMINIPVGFQNRSDAMIWPLW